MRVALIGHGSWGHRVRSKIDGYIVSIYDEKPVDDERYTGDAWHSDPDHAIIATPPGERLEYVTALVDAGVKKIRIEKPLALSVDEAQQIVDVCEGRALLTVGFTLLHDRLYELALAYLSARQLRTIRLDSVRIGKRPVHRVNPLLDMGAHTAAIAAFVRCEAQLSCAYTDAGSMRVTTFVTERGNVVVDELAQRVTTPDGTMFANMLDTGDTLERDLSAWLDGTHRGTADVAMRTQMILDEHLEVAVKA